MLEAQTVKIFWEDLRSYIVSEPTYLFHRYRPYENEIVVNDSNFITFISNTISSLEKCQTCKCESYIWPAMIQIIYIIDNNNYETINMTHSLTSKTLDFGCLELNGKMMNYSKDFQEVIDEIVNYHIVNNLRSANVQVINSILEGKRFNSHPYLPPPPNRPRCQRQR